MIVFIHIPKTGGTTLKDLFLKVAPERTQYFNDPHQFESTMAAMPDQASLQADYIGGHVPFEVMSRELGRLRPSSPELYVTLLRDPVERAYSFFLFLQRVPTAIPHIAAMTAGKDFAYFVEAMYEHGDWQLRDGQAWMICGKRCADSAINAAETRFALVGTTESYDGFYAALRSLSDLPLPPYPEVEHGKVAPRDGRTTRWRDLVDATTISRLEAINQADFTLFERVRSMEGGLLLQP